jgi:hypothetical protein
MQARAAVYAQAPGVRSVALGYRGATPTTRCDAKAQGCSISPQQVVQIEAVDAASFAQTAIWPAQDAAQPLASLMAQLAAQRDAASSNGVVPVILDRTAAANLSLAPGASFTLPAPVQVTSGGPPNDAASSPDMRFSVVAVVPYLPGIYGDNGGGLLADYATFAAVYSSVSDGAAPTAVAPNFVWLRTASDAVALASVRAAIATGPLALSALQEANFLAIQAPVSDRRALATDLHGDPLRLTAIGILPRRVRAEIGWEQGIIYGAALGLGALFGAALIEAMLRPLPLLIFARDLLHGPIEDGGPAARIIWPWPALAAVLGALIVICGVATLLAARLAARPSLARILRLSEE